jgi:hypothetical protein
MQITKKKKPPDLKTTSRISPVTNPRETTANTRGSVGADGATPVGAVVVSPVAVVSERNRSGGNQPI